MHIVGNFDIQITKYNKKQHSDVWLHFGCTLAKQYFCMDCCGFNLHIAYSSSFSFFHVALSNLKEDGVFSWHCFLIVSSESLLCVINLETKKPI